MPVKYPIRTKENASKSDFDVQLDWLYKGKRRSRPKGLPARPERTQQAAAGAVPAPNAVGKMSPPHATPATETAPMPSRRSRSKSISNAVLSESKAPNEWGKVKQEAVAKASAQKEVGSPVASPSDPKRSRSRSSTLSKITGTGSGDNSTSDVSSMSQQQAKGSGLKRSASVSEKPKRSIFSALFGKKQPVQAPAPPQEPAAKQKPLQITVSTAPSDAPVVTSPVTAAKIAADKSETRLDAIKEQRSSDLKRLSKEPIRRVRFAVDKIDSDPPQQLPSRNPRPGNILIPQEMIGATPLISVGISSSKTPAANGDAAAKDASGNAPASPATPTTPGAKFTKDSKEYKIALEHYNRSLRESQRRQIESHEAAEVVAKEVRGYKFSPLKKIRSNDSQAGADDADVKIDSSVMSSIVDIDKPTNTADAHPFKNMDSDAADAEPNSPTSNKSALEDMTLDVIYTRCCHLREILPIPSTLRQVKGKTAPLHVIKFLNPRPTLIDILSFCDFISIVPIHMVIFDNVALTSEMLRIVLSSVVNSKVLEKLGLRNVVINPQDWTFFCKFLLQNKSLIKLDISQTKTRSEQDLSTYRENMNWTLLADVLASRKGRALEELLLNGIKVSYIPLEEFMEVLTIFGKRNHGRSKQRLGMAMTDLGVDHLKNMFNWMSQYTIQGVDLAFNNLEPLMKPIIDKLSLLNYDHLEYFTLNSTELTDIDTATKLLRALSLLPNLQFLDMSNIPALFPGIFPALNDLLPKFKQLKRIHLDNNNMDDKQLTLLCNILVKCKTLSHISLLATGAQAHAPLEKIPTAPDNAGPDGRRPPAMAPAGEDKSTMFIKSSLWGQYYSLANELPNLLSLDINYDSIPDELQSRIALCLMRNMKTTMDSTFQIDELTSQDELLFDGSLLTDTADQVLQRLEEKGETPGVANTDMDASRKYMLKKYIEKLDNVLKKTQITIDLMLEKSKADELPMQEKENLLRLLLLKRNLSNIMEILLDVPKDGSAGSGGSTTSGGAAIDGQTQPVSSFDNAGDTIMTPTTPYARPDLRHMDSSRLLTQAVGTVAQREELRAHDREEKEVDLQRPHLMATDSGRVIDVLTGRQVLHKSSSNTSLASKRQEQEEGELHKWGSFRQRTSRLNGDQPPIEPSPATPPPTSTTPPAPSSKDKPKILPRIPTGEELRNAIMEAKGIDSIDELIKRVSDNKSELESIYNVALHIKPGENSAEGGSTEDGNRSV